MTRVHVMTADIAEAFYRICSELNADTPEERTKILDAMAKEGLMKQVYDTGRSRDEILKDFSKNYKTLVVNTQIGVQK